MLIINNIKMPSKCATCVLENSERKGIFFPHTRHYCQPRSSFEIKETDTVRHQKRRSDCPLELEDEYYPNITAISKENALWHNEDEYIVMEENDWKIIAVINHYKNKIWYEIKTPEEAYLPEFYDNIFKAIERVEKEKNQ